MTTKTTEKQLAQTATKALNLGNGFYGRWQKKKNIADGRLAISAFNTSLKAHQTIIDLRRITKTPDKQIKAAKRKVATVKKSIAKVKPPGNKKPKKKR